MPISWEKLEAKKALLDRYRPLPKALAINLEEWFKVELTYTSNAIEGNTLSRKETAMIVEKGLTVAGKTLKEHLEAINHAEALEWIKKLVGKKRKDISEEHILGLHHLILKKIDDENAGKYRTVRVRIAGSTVILPNPMKVPPLINKFIMWLHSKTAEHCLQTAADSHFKLVSIHPFTDGNGRTARLLMNLLLLQKGYPPALIRKEDRARYIDAVEKGQLQGELSDYYQIIYEAVDRSLDIYLEALEEKEMPTGEKPAKKDLLKIGQLAKISGESVPTIRFWTKEGLLPVAGQTPKGYQLFSRDCIERIKKIRTLQEEKRLTLEEIKKAFGRADYFGFRKGR